MSEDFDKYLSIANHDIQMANDDGQLKSYVASILYDYDKKVELLQQKENKEKEIREYITRKDICIDTRKTDGSMDYVDLEKDLLEILDKENK